jgi:hypothetical protein
VRTGFKVEKIHAANVLDLLAEAQARMRGGFGPNLIDAIERWAIERLGEAGLPTEFTVNAEEKAKEAGHPLDVQLVAELRNEIELWRSAVHRNDINLASHHAFRIGVLTTELDIHRDWGIAIDVEADKREARDAHNRRRADVQKQWVSGCQPIATAVWKKLPSASKTQVAEFVKSELIRRGQPGAEGINTDTLRRLLIKP